MKNKNHNLANSTIKVVAAENLDVSEDLNNNQYKTIAELYGEEETTKKDKEDTTDTQSS